MNTLLFDTGYMVVCPTEDRSPRNDWDGMLYADRDEAMQQVRAARNEGFEAHLARWDVLDTRYFS